MFNRRSFIALASILAALILMPSVGLANMCKRLFIEGPHIFDVDLSGHELSNWQKISDNFEKTKAKLDSDTQSKMEEVWDAFLFFDYAHAQPKIVDNFLVQSDISKLSLQKLYGDTKSSNVVVDTMKRFFEGDKKSNEVRINHRGPFGNYRELQVFLKSLRETKVTISLMQKMHELLMKDWVEELPPELLGTYRKVAIIGLARGERPLSREEVQIVESNPYLHFDIQNISQKTGKYEGQIIYPTPNRLKPEILDRIELVNPDLAARLETIQGKQSKVNQVDPDSPKLMQELMEALVVERFNWFEASIKDLGRIELGTNHLEFVDLVAQFQRDLVAIHPFRNGNGRTTRALMNFLLESNGLPPARLLSPDLDVQYSLQYWQRAIKRGIQNSLDVKRDLTERIEHDLPTHNSSVVLYPALPESVFINQKTAGSQKIDTNHRLAEVDKNQFSAFVLAKMELDPSLSSKIASIETLNKLADEFTQFQRAKIIDYIHKKDGERELRQKLVDLDFMSTFGLITAFDRDAWNYKIDRWYDKSTLIWRGLSNRSHEYTDVQLLSYFRVLNSHMASNRVASRAQTQKEFREEMLADFSQYNRELITGEYVKMAHDHSTTGPRYAQSYGLSTSKNEQVGKAFAMGAMVIADYGKHRDPELQKLLRSRINIASFKSAKDLDLGRIKAFNHEFSYEYGRQQEVMAIGGADPDSIMIIQRIDAQGNVLNSLVRDLTDPNRVHKVSGRYTYEDGPLKQNQIEKTYYLNNGK